MLCKIIPKLIFYNSHLTRNFSRDIDYPTATTPFIIAVPSVFVSSLVS